MLYITVGLDESLATSTLALAAVAGGHGGFGDGGGHHGGPGGHGLGLATAASYLGLTEAQLRTELESERYLADVAKAKGKSVAGLKSKLKAGLETKLDAAVKAGRITRAPATRSWRR